MKERDLLENDMHKGVDPARYARDCQARTTSVGPDG